MESILTKHILPRFGELLVEQVTERAVQEWVADLRRQTFAMKKLRIPAKLNADSGEAERGFWASRTLIGA
jgi:hypothetical protein